VLIHHNLLVPQPTPSDGLANFAVLSVKEFDA